MAAEFDFIGWLKTQQRASHLVMVPAGDDLAVLNWPPGDLLIVGADQVLDGVHFDSAVHSPRQIGAKVMKRNLSDCAAMGCLPAAAVVSAALPRGCALEFAKELYLGMKEAGEDYGCAIVGGDTGSWAGKLALSVTILGRSAGIAPVTRGGARTGDRLFVTGALGGSILGRHMTFVPRIGEARELAAVPGQVHAMIDLSDGLSRDLGHIAGQSGVGAIIDAAAIPIHEDAQKLSQRDGIAALDHALNDGEDYELLIASPAVSLPHCTCIGRVTAERDLQLRHGDGTVGPLLARGWEHG